MKLEESIRFCDLVSLYVDLLPPSQQVVLKQYFLNNLTINEIASEHNISKQAVSDAINKGKEKLEFFEQKLSMLAMQYKKEIR